METEIISRTSQENTMTQTILLVSDAVRVILHSYNWLCLIIRPTGNHIMSFRNIFRVRANYEI